MKYFLIHFNLFIENPIRYFDNLLDTKYWKLHKKILLIPYIISLIFTNINNKNLFFFDCEKKNNFLIKQIKNLIYYLNFSILFIKFYYERYYGSFYQYSIAREKYLRFVKFYNNKNSYLNKKNTFELNSYSKIKSLRKIWEDLLKAENHITANFNAFNKKEFKSSSNNMRSIFRDKKVLIIGPSEFDESIEFEKYDLICLANTFYKDLIGKKIKKEQIIIFSNISYFSRNKKKLIDFRKSVNNVLIKPPLKGDFINFLTCDHLLNNNYGPMAMQNLILSIILGQAKSLFITGVNAYIGKVVYRKGIKNFEKNLLQYNNQIRRHEPLSNFCFIKNIYQLNLIEGDKEFKKVFSLSPREYCKKLDEIYKGLEYKLIRKNLWSN